MTYISLRERNKDTKLVSKVAELRDRHGYTQRELALYLGVTDTTVANWEKGRSGLEWFERIANLCQLLDCTPQQLVVREPVQKPSIKQKDRKPDEKPQSETSAKSDLKKLRKNYKNGRRKNSRSKKTSEASHHKPR